jgi:hypothetical protein
MPTVSIRIGLAIGASKQQTGFIGIHPSGIFRIAIKILSSWFFRWKG